MSFLTYLLLTVFIHIVAGQIAGHNMPGTINSASPQFGKALPNAQLLNTNTQLARNMAIPTFNHARNVPATVGSSNVANSVNAVAAGNTYKAITNVNPNLATVNTASQNYASNLANANVRAPNLGIRNIGKPNLANAANPGFATSVYNPNAVSTLPGNIVSSKAMPQYRLGSSNNPAQTYNPISSNFASNLAIGNGGVNHAKVNGWYPNVSGDSYISPALGSPGSQQYGIHIEADALEIAGNVAVTGNMPFSGTVSLNGKLSTEGAGSVNYACSS